MSTKTDPAPPPRAMRRPSVGAGSEAAANQFLAAYIMGVANRLASGASQFYRRQYSLGMPEWRAMMAIGTRTDLIVRQVAELADLDYAAASKSLKLLQQRGWAELEQTQTRGRAAIARLTPEGLALYRQLRRAATRRQQRLLAQFTPQEVALLWALLRRVEAAVPQMNAESR